MWDTLYFEQMFLSLEFKYIKFIPLLFILLVAKEIYFLLYEFSLCLFYL
jgi:hypothetical protein